MVHGWYNMSSSLQKRETHGGGGVPAGWLLELGLNMYYFLMSQINFLAPSIHLHTNLHIQEKGSEA